MQGSGGLAAFAPGDLFVGATLLDDPADDHAGRGRILQYGADLAPKGVLWLEGTTHLVGGLKFDPQGRLWAFDSHAAAVRVIDAAGRVASPDFGGRPFSNVNFGPDGSLYLAEHVVGDHVRPEVAARMRTRIPFMRGTARFGDGHVFRHAPDGRFLQEHATATHGGMAGFLGVTMSTLAPDGRTLVYCSETGPRLMRYDLLEDRQLPDLQAFPEGRREMFFSMAYGGDGLLYVLRGTRIDVLDADGATLRSLPLEGIGWALMILAHDGVHAFVANFFSGEIARLDLGSGAVDGVIRTEAPKAVAGLAEFAGPGPASGPR